MVRLTLVLLLALLLGACGSGDSGPDVVRSGSPEVASAIGGNDSRTIDRTGWPRVLFLGTSLTAGMGLDDPDTAFPGRVQHKIDSAGLRYEVVNGGVSGDTSAGGLARLDWLLDGDLRVLVLELGANDGLRGLDTDALRTNLSEIIRRTRSEYPDVRIILAGMEAPPNMGTRYAVDFRLAFREVAEREDAVLIPFLLDGVAGVPELNQDDRIHPTAGGHEIIAGIVWEVLEPLFRTIQG